VVFLCYGLDFSSSGVCIFVCVCVCVCIYIYICMYVCVYIYILYICTYIYIYVHIEKGFGFVDSIIGLIDFYEHRMP